MTHNLTALSQEAAINYTVLSRREGTPSEKLVHTPLEGRTEIEYRQIDCHDDEEDDAGNQNNQDRGYQRGEAGHRGIDLFVVEESRLGEHLFDLSGLLPGGGQR